MHVKIDVAGARSLIFTIFRKFALSKSDKHKNVWSHRCVPSLAKWSVAPAAFYSASITLVQEPELIFALLRLRLSSSRLNLDFVQSCSRCNCKSYNGLDMTLAYPFSNLLPYVYQVPASFGLGITPLTGPRRCEGRFLIAVPWGFRRH